MTFLIIPKSSSPSVSNAVPRNNSGSWVNAGSGNVQCLYSATDDTTGIINRIGTNDNTGAFSNPVPSKITMTHTGGSLTGALSSLTDRNEGTSINYSKTTTPLNNGTIVFEFITHRVKLFSYLMTNHHSSAGALLRAWFIEGSNDNSTWVILDTREDEVLARDLTQKIHYICNSFQDTYYRYLRIRTNGFDSSAMASSNSPTATIRMCNIELYGGCQTL